MWKEAGEFIGHTKKADHNGSAFGAWDQAKTGAGDEIRTHDPNLGKVVLYP